MHVRRYELCTCVRSESKTKTRVTILYKTSITAHEIRSTAEGARHQSDPIFEDSLNYD